MEIKAVNCHADMLLTRAALVPGSKIMIVALSAELNSMKSDRLNVTQKNSNNKMHLHSRPSSAASDILYT